MKIQQMTPWPGKAMVRSRTWANAALNCAARPAPVSNGSGRYGHRGSLVAGLVCLLAMTGAAAQTLQTEPVAAGAREWVTPPAGDAMRGAALYQANCVSCHATDSHQTGPAHRGVMGRRLGSAAGYTYSKELAASRLRWTPQTLNTWLTDPEELVAGQRMGFQVEDVQERADLIAYLATLRNR